MFKKIEYARKLAEEEKYDEAEDVLKSLLDLDEDNSLVYYELGKVYLDRESFQEAIEVLEKTLYMEPDFFQAYLVLGLAYEKLHRLYSAEQCYIKAIELKTHFWAPYTQLASLYREQKDLIRAQDILEKALEKNCSHHLLHMNLGSVYSLRGFLDSALEQLLIAKKLAPRSQEILSSLGELYIARREYDEALEIFKEKQRLYPEDSFSYQHTGSVYHTMLDFGEAEKFYNEAISKENADAGIYYLLALIKIRVHEDYEGAIKDCEKALKLDPEFVSAYFAEVECYYHMGLLSKAREKYENLITLNPDNPVYYMALGTYYLHCEEFEKSLKTYHKAIEVNQKDRAFKSIYGAYVSLGRTYELSGNLPKAFEYIKIPLIEEPYCGELHFELGRLYRKTGEKEKSMRSFERVSQLVPNAVMGYCARAYNYLEAGDIEGAEREVRKGENYSYKSDKVSYLMGLIEEKRENREKAMYYYKKTVKYNHLHMEAREALLRLKVD